MLLFALYFLWMGSHPSFFIYKVFLSFLLLSLVIHPPFIPYFCDHLSVINHPTLSLVKINAILSVLLLTHSSCFLQFFSFIYLSRIIQTFHSLVNFIQSFSFIYFSSLIQQNLIHLFVIVIHPMFTMQPSIIQLSFIFHFMSIFPI